MKQPRAHLTRFFRFSLRGVLIAFALFAVLLAILSAPVRQAARQRRIIREVDRLGGTVWFADEQFHDGDEYGYSQRHRQSADLSWYERYVSDAYLRQVVMIHLDQRNDVPPELLRSFAELPHLKQVTLSPLVARSAGIERLKRLNPQCIIAAEWNMGNAPVTTLTTQDEFNAAIEMGEVVLFVDGGLSINVQLSRPNFAETAAMWFDAHPASDVRFLRVDYQRSASPAWLAALQLQLDQGVDSEEIEKDGAAGRVLWIRDGVLVRDDPSLRRTTVEEVMQRTEEAFDQVAR